MKTIRRKYIIISIIVLLVLVAILFYNRRNVNAFTTQRSEASASISDNNINDNMDNDITNDENIAVKGTIQEKNDSDYTVQLSVSGDKCITSVVDDENNNTIIDNSNHKATNATSNTEMQKGKEYKLDVNMANGQRITKSFELVSAKITLGVPVQDDSGNWTLPYFTINNPCGDKLKNIVLQFASEIQDGDTLSILDKDNVTVNRTATLISIDTENLTSDEIQDYIRSSFKVKLVNNSTQNPVAIKVSTGDTTIDKTLNYCAATNHYYEFVAAPGISWSDAKNAAASRTYLGQQGYLATITSAEEQKFIESLVKGYGWVGGTCDYNYIFDSNGNKIYNSLDESLWNWYWVTGPEAGQKFYDKSGTLNKYTNWAPGEPNHWENIEYYLHLYDDGEWNDFPMSTGSISGYIVEYGGMPGDSLTLDPSYIDEGTIPVTKIAAAKGGPVISNTDNIQLQDDNGNTIAIPAGFKVANDSATVQDDGIVIEDKDGNQFVWIPVANISDYARTDFGKQAGAYTTYSETMPTDEQTSVNTYHGYYIGRYEAGDKESTINKTMRNGSVITDTVTTKKGQAPYNYVTRDQASTLSTAMKTTEGYNATTKLCSSYAWDTAIKFIQKNISDYATTSNHGNYNDSELNYTDVEGAKQNKGLNANTLIPTGQTIPECNIYDMGGNTWEWTTETSNYEDGTWVYSEDKNTGAGSYRFYGTSYPYTCRGGSCADNFTDYSAGYRIYSTGDFSYNVGFRPTLYM